MLHLPNYDILQFLNELHNNISYVFENCRNAPTHFQDDMSDEDLMKAFTSMGMEDSPDNIMQGMMKTLLSKEVLYPSLKELSQKVSRTLLP